MTDRNPPPPPPRRRASPFHELLGLELVEWHEGHCAIRCVTRPAHLNRNGIVHGGVLMALLDEAGAAAGVWSPPGAPERRSVTVNLTAGFVGRVGIGTLIATGTVIGGGRKLFFCRSEIRDAAGTLVAAGTSTHRRTAGPE